MMVVFGFSYSMNNTIVAFVRKFVTKEDFFKAPFNSSLVDVYYIENPSSVSVRLPHNNGFVVFPL